MLMKLWSARGARCARDLVRDARGDAAVEYLFLVATIALPAIAAFAAVGKAIVENYATMQSVLLLPVP